MKSFSSTAGNDDSAALALNFPNEPWSGDLLIKQLGRNFTPALGFVNRTAIRQYVGTLAHLTRYRNRYLNTLEFGTDFERIEISVSVTRQMRQRTDILPDRGAVDEAKRRREIPAKLLDKEIAGPGLVGKVERQRRRIVVACRAREALHVIGVRLEDLVAEDVRIAILKVSAGDRICGQPGGIAVGEDETDLGFGEDRMCDARQRQNLDDLSRRRLVG